MRFSIVCASLTALFVASIAASAVAAEPAASTRVGAQSDTQPEDGPKNTDGHSRLEPPPASVWDSSDVNETPGKAYYFVGVRYRGNVVPRFVLNLFVDEAKTVYTNAVGVELDYRRDNFSLVPALTFAEYGTGDILFKQKGKPDIPGNYALVNSSMKAIYASVDLLWSTKLGKNVDFEYGAGLGLGVVFGDLVNNWVKVDPNGSLTGENGRRYAACAGVEAPTTGCNKADHQNSDVDKVGGYQESSWFNGGSKPSLFPWITPQIGLRFKPVKQMVGRLGIGFGLTGFWFGLSGDYGLEQRPKP